MSFQYGIRLKSGLPWPTYPEVPGAWTKDTPDDLGRNELTPDGLVQYCFTQRDLVACCLWGFEDGQPVDGWAATPDEIEAVHLVRDQYQPLPSERLDALMRELAYGDSQIREAYEARS